MRRQLVAILRDDRHVAELRQEQSGEVVDLRRRRRATREDAEVDPHLARRDVRGRAEGKRLVECFHGFLLLRRLPTKTPESDDCANQAPRGDNADAPSAERTTTVIASPSAANATAPSSRTSTSDSQRCGSGTSNMPRPIAIIAAEFTRKAINVEPSTAPMYAHGGSGVARTRLRIPDSRRITRKIARPAKAVETSP